MLTQRLMIHGRDGAALVAAALPSRRSSGPGTSSITAISMQISTTQHAYA